MPLPLRGRTWKHRSQAKRWRKSLAPIRQATGADLEGWRAGGWGVCHEARIKPRPSQKALQGLYCESCGVKTFHSFCLIEVPQADKRLA